MKRLPLLLFLIVVFTKGYSQSSWTPADVILNIPPYHDPTCYHLAIYCNIHKKWNVDSVEWKKNNSLGNVKNMKFIAGPGISLTEDTTVLGTVNLLSEGRLPWQRDVSKLPEDSMVGLDTLRGVVGIIDLDGNHRFVKAIKVSQVYKHWYDEYYDPNQTYTDGFGNSSSTAMLGYLIRKTSSVLKIKDIVLNNGKRIDLDKWYEFIPSSKFQNFKTAVIQ